MFLVEQKKAPEQSGAFRMFLVEQKS